jgi:hypothetical protein
VVDLDGLVAWNNLGRNLVFADANLDPLAIFGETAFPDDDETSQYDLDLHAIAGDAEHIVALNHLGMLRVFNRADVRAGRAAPLATLQAVEDSERMVMAAGRLWFSTDHGLLASPPLGEFLRSMPRPESEDRVALPLAAAFPALGKVTAIHAGASFLALGSEGSVSLYRWSSLAPVWQAVVDVIPAWVGCDERRLFVAGPPPAPEVDDHDWNSLDAGVLFAFDLQGGALIYARPFAPAIAWGNGGVALALENGRIHAVDRRGQVHTFAAGDGARVNVTDPLADRSLGIAHACSVSDRLVFGFNRAGYRLFHY